jgi:hypothetical protein
MDIVIDFYSFATTQKNDKRQKTTNSKSITVMEKQCETGVVVSLLEKRVKITKEDTIEAPCGYSVNYCVNYRLHNGCLTLILKHV